MDQVPARNPSNTSTTTESADWTNRRATAQALRAASARQVSGRRRFVDPTTCDRDYSQAEMEFMQAMQDYKRSSGRMFPTWSEVLEVLRGLGYEKPPASDLDDPSAEMPPAPVGAADGSIDNSPRARLS